MNSDYGPPRVRPSIILRNGGLVNGIDYSHEFRFILAQKTCAPVINYLADVVEDVFFKTVARQAVPLSRSNWSLLEAGFSRAFAFHITVVTGAPTIVILVVLVYLERMRTRLVIPPACLVHGLVPERLLLGAWLLAFQSLYNVTNHRFDVWADATKLFSSAEVEQTIGEIKNVLDDDLSFTEVDMHGHCINLVGFYESWSALRVQNSAQGMGGHPEDGINGFMSDGRFQDRVLPVQQPLPGMSLTGGVQRRSVRLVCRSTGR